MESGNEQKPFNFGKRKTRKIGLKIRKLILFWEMMNMKGLIYNLIGKGMKVEQVKLDKEIIELMEL